VLRVIAARPSRELLGLAAEIAALPVPDTVEEEHASWNRICAPLDAASDAAWEPADAGGVPCVWTWAGPCDACTILYCHGGAFAIGSPWHNRDMMSRIARAAGGRVLGVDYRLAPEHPFPAALEDTVAAYRWLLESGVDPATVVLAGDSCGANLVLGAALRARGADLPLPAAIAAISPWVDLTQAGWSYETNAARDPFVTKASMDYLAASYLAGASAEDPAASPLFAELAGLPPVLVQVGAGEALLAESVALVERLGRAGGFATLEIWPHGVHVWPMWAARVPEAQAAIEHLAAFAVSAVAGAATASRVP
jgi:acetyl esterase/lipase